MPPPTRASTTTLKSHEISLRAVLTVMFVPMTSILVTVHQLNNDSREIQMPPCQMHLMAEPDMAGQIVTCPGCTTKLQIPAEATKPSAAAHQQSASRCTRGRAQAYQRPAAGAQGVEGRGSDQSQRAAKLRHRYRPYRLMVCHRLSVPGAAWDLRGELHRHAVAREPVLQALHRQLRQPRVLFLAMTFAYLN